MKNLPDDFKISAAILSLGLSYVRPGLDQDEDKKNQQVNVSNTILEESTEEDSLGIIENGEHSYEKETKILCNDYDENIQESDKKTKIRFDKEKLSNTERSKEKNLYKKPKRKKFNELSEKSSENYIKMFRKKYKMENEVTSKLYEETQPINDTGLQKEIINEVRQKVNEKIKSYNNKSIGVKEHEEEKNDKFGNYARELIFKLKCKEPYGTDLSRDFFTNVITLSGQNQDLKVDIKQEYDEEMQLKLNEKVLEELNGEKVQKPEGETVIKMEVDSEFQKELFSEVEENFIKEKQPVSVRSEMKVDSEYQNELDNENVRGEHEGKKKLLEDNNEEDESIQLHLEMEIDPKLQPRDVKLQLFIKFENNSESENELDNKFEELGNKQSMPEIKLKVNDCVHVNSEFQQELSEKIQKEIKGGKFNCIRDESVESVKKWQQNPNLIKEIQDESNNKSFPSNESKIQEKSNECINLQKKQKVLVDTQHTVDEEKQVNSNTEQKLPGKIEKLFENVHGKFGYKQLEINVDEQLTTDELQKKIDEIQRKADNLEQEIDVESEKKIIEEINKVSTPAERVKLLKKYYLALEEKLTPIEERIEYISKNYFPPELVLVRKNDKKKQIDELIQHLEKTFVQNDDEVQTEIKRKVSTDLDLNCDDVEEKMQEKLGNEVEHGSHVEFRGQLDEKLKDSDDNYKKGISEELGNVRLEKSGPEMLEHCCVALEESLKEEKDSDLDVDGSSQNSCEDELDEDLLEDSNIVGEIQEHLEGKQEEVQGDCKRESDEEDSFIDVEGFDEGEIQNGIDTQPVSNFLGGSLSNSEEESEEENEEHFGKCVDINIVTEVVEDYIVEKRVLDSTPIEECTPTEVFCELDKFSTEAKELNSTEELNTLKRKKSINQKVKQKLFMKKQVKFNENIQEFEKKTQEHNFVKTQQKFKHFVENMPDFDKIPPELKIEQEQIDYKLQQQFREFQEEFYKTFKQEYDKGKKIFNSDSSTFNKQQQTFYELKDEFNKIKEDYKSFVLQKFFEDLQQKIDKENLLGIEELPKELNDNLYPQIDEHIEKEFAEMERDYYGLESEFKYNVPLEFELNNSSKFHKKKLKKKPFNLFEKLNSIHQKKLYEFANSTTWPENCLYPSSLLDLLFEDPSEEKPNFIVITLYPIDIGYSLKISMKINEPPVEIFFDYTTDSILKYIEKEKLPPDLLELFDRAEPSIFYSGCVIAEIHDQIEYTNNRVSRILLRPSNESILRDLNQIIADNSSVDWTHERRLWLESQLLASSYPVMCLDSLPIAGSAVQLQHRLLGCRNISLNPIRHVLETDDLNNDMCSSNLPHEASSKMMDNTSEDMHNILWKFDFRIESIKIIKLYILFSTETQDFSLLLCSNLEFESDVNMRVKINLTTNQLKPYIFMILEILKQRINPVINVFRRYKNDDKSAPRYLSCVTTLVNNKTYEPSHSDISEIIDTFLEMKSRKQGDQVKFPTLPIQSDDDDDDDDDHLGNKKVNSFNEENSHHFSTNHLTENQYFGIFNMNLRGSNDSNSTSDILPTSISATKISSLSNPNEMEPILSSSLLVTSGPTTITSSALSPTNIPSVSNPVTVISSLPSLINVISSVPSHITVVSSTTSKVSSSEISSFDGVLASKILSTREDHNVNIDTKLKPITASKTDHIENLNKNDDYALNLFDNVEHKSPTIYDIMKTASETNVTQSLNSQSVEKTKVIKHVHGSGICLRKVFPKHTVNMKVVPQKSILLQKNILVQQSTSNSQLDSSMNLSKFTDLENSANSEVSTVTRHSSEDVFDEFQKLFGETSSSTNNLKNISKNGK